MKKFILLSVITIIFVGLIYTYPQKINFEVEGMEYRLGNEGYAKTLILKFDGKFIRGLFSGDKFIGDIYINETKLEDQKLKFNNNYDYLFIYNEEIGEYEYWGALFTNSKFNKFTINVFEEETKGKKQWNSSYGLMISAPSNSRDDAILISNELMNEKLINTSLE